MAGMKFDPPLVLFYSSCEAIRGWGCGVPRVAFTSPCRVGLKEPATSGELGTADLVPCKQSG